MSEQQGNPANQKKPTVADGVQLDSGASAPDGGFGLPQVSPQYASTSIPIRQEGDTPAVMVKTTPLQGSRIGMRKSLVISAFVTLAVVMLTGLGMVTLVRKNADRLAPSSALDVQTQDITLKNGTLDRLPEQLEGDKNALLVNGNIVTRGELRISNGDSVTVIRAAEGATGNQTFVLPSTSGTICLESNNCSYATAGDLQQVRGQLNQVGSPNIPASSLVNNQTGSLSLQGSGNQISVITGNGIITFATPQDIATISSPTFSNLVLTSNLTASGVIISSLNCSGLANGGALTTNGSGQLVCSDDDGGSGSPVSGSGNANRLTMFSGSTTLADSWLIQNGSTLQLDATRNFTLVNGNLTLGSATSDLRIMEAVGGLYYGAFDVADLSTDQTYTLPDASGTVCLTSGNCVGVGGTGDVLNNGQNGPLTVGTNNATSLALETNNVARLTISATGDVTIGGGVSAASFTGNGSALTDLNGSAVTTGTVGNARLTGAGSLTVTAGNGLSGGGSVALGSSVGLAVAYGSAANTAVQGNIAINCATVSGNLTGGGGSITLGSGGSCTAIGLTATPTFTTVNATTFTGALAGNATTASALANTPTGCGANTVARSIAANGNLTCSGVVDADVSDTLTASIFIGTGSATGAVDLGTAEIAGVLADANVSDTLTIGAASTVANGALSASVSLLGQTINGTEVEDGSIANIDLANSSLTVSAGNGLSGGGAVTLGSSTSLSVAYGATANTAVQGDTAINCATVSGNLTGGGGSITLGSGGSCSAIGFTASPSFTTTTTTNLAIGVDNFNDLTGNGLQATSNTLAVLAVANKGITVSASGVALMNCSSGQILKYNVSNEWACAPDDGGGGGVTTVGSLDGGTPHATDGANISGSTIYLQSATNLRNGIVTTGSQTFAGTKTFNGGVVLAANQTLSLTGGTTASRPGSPTEGMVYFDTDTKQLLTYANGKWQSDRTTATKIVAASNSSQAIKDGADYVSDGTDDQVEINNALTAAAGGKVYLAEGTYTIGDTAISVPNNTSLNGAGKGTLLRLSSGSNSNALITNTTAGGAGTGITIQDMTLDGSQRFAGSQDGVYLAGVGTNTRVGATVTNITARSFRGAGIHLRPSSYSTITGNTLLSNLSMGLLVYSTTHTKIANNTIAANNDAVYLYTSSDNVFTGNAISDNAGSGFYFDGAGQSHRNIISSNVLTYNGGSGSSSGIHVNGNGNLIVNNRILDSAGTGYAIELSGGTANHLTGNMYSGTGASSINDAATATVYGGQLTGSNFTVQPAGTIELIAATNIIGNLDVSGSLAVGGSNQFAVSNSGELTFTGVALDVTTGTNEDLTVIANGSGQIYLNDTVRISSLISCDTIDSDATGVLSCGSDSGGAGSTLQAAYTADVDGGNAIINLTSADGGVIIRDNATPIGSTLFAVQDNAGGNSYFAVTDTAIGTSGDLVVGGNSLFSGSLKVDGRLALGSDGDVVNPGQLVTTGTLTAVLDVAHVFTDLTSTDIVAGTSTAVLLDAAASSTSNGVAAFNFIATEATNSQDYGFVMGGQNVSEHRGSGLASGLAGVAGGALNEGSGSVGILAGVFSSSVNQASGTAGYVAGNFSQADNHGSAEILTGSLSFVVNRGGGEADYVSGANISVENEATAIAGSLGVVSANFENIGTVTTDAVGINLNLGNNGSIGQNFIGNQIDVENQGSVGGGIIGNRISVTNDTTSNVTSVAGVTIEFNNESNGDIGALFGQTIDTLTNTGGGVINSIAGLSVFGQNAGTNSNKTLTLGVSAGATTNVNLQIGASPVSGNYSIYNTSTYDNYFAGALGIGVVPTGNGMLSLEASGTNNGVYSYTTGTAGSAGLFGNSNIANTSVTLGVLGVPSQAGNYFAVANSLFGNPLFVVDDSGNVGIGQANPTALLTVGSGSRFQVSSVGQLLFNGVGTDITTTSGEDLTLLAAGVGSVIVNDTLRVTSLISCDTIDSDASGNLSCGTDTGGAGSTLQAAYTADVNGGDAIIGLTSTDGGILIRDNASPIGSTLFAVQSSGGAEYLSVTAAGINVGVEATFQKTITLIGDATSQRPTGTQGMIYFDTDTQQLLVFDANTNKWQADRSESIILASNTSSQVAKDSADYVLPGTNDEVAINYFLSLADPVNGGKGKVYLMAGSYSIGASISVPNNTTLAGSGPGTKLQFANLGGASVAMIVNDDIVNGSGVVIRDMLLDGNSSVNTSGSVYGVFLDGVGIAANTAPATVNGITATGFVGDGNATDNAGIAFGDGLAIVTNCSAVGNTTGILLGAAVGSVLTNNIVSSGVSSSIGILVLSSTNTVIANNAIRLSSATSFGMHVNSSTGLSISNNTIDGSIAYGVSLSDIADSALTDNTINSGTGALAMSNVDDTIIANNSMKNATGQTTLQLSSGSDGNTISNNILTNGYSLSPRLISIDGSANNIVSSNKLHATSAGLGLDGMLYFSSADSNSITDNTVSAPSCGISCVAINISSSASDTNHFAGNRLDSTFTFTDAGTGTVYDGQMVGNTFKISGNLFQGGTGINTLGDSGSMIPNASFEVNVDNTLGVGDSWTFAQTVATATPSISNTAPGNGDHSQQIAMSAASSEATLTSACVPISGSQTYSLSVRIIVNVGVTNGFDSFLDTYTSKANCLSNTSVIAVNGSANAAVTNVWSAQTANPATGLTATWARVRLRVGSASSTATYKVDGVRLTPSALNTGVDLAENFAAVPESNLLPGQLVSYGAETADGAFAVLSSGQYDDKLFGVVSTQPGQVLDDGKDYEKVQVALAGRVPVLVNDENGAIAIGDPITASSVPGVGMKATGAGQIIGYAMTAYNGSGEGGVIVKLAPGFWAPSMSGILQAQQASFGSLQVTGTAAITGLNVSGQANIASLVVSGNVTVQGELAVIGNVTVANLYVGGQLISKGPVPTITNGAALGSVLGATTGVSGTSAAGTVTVTIGANAVTNGDLAEVTFAAAYGQVPRVVITPKNAASASVQVYVQVTPTGFKLVTSNTPGTNSNYEFDYIVIGAEN